MIEKIVVVIPTFNEAQNISSLAKELFSFFKSKRFNLSLIIVDDSSTDGTIKIVKELALKFPIKLSVRPKKLGLGSAYKHGFREALKQNPNFIVQMDADFSHHPNDLNLFLEKIKKSDIVFGSRYVKKSRFNFSVKTVASILFNKAAKILLGLPVNDSTGGFRIFKANALKKINLQNIKADDYSFQLEIAFRATKAGLKIVEVPINFSDRIHGKSKFSISEIIAFNKKLVELLIFD